MFKNMKLMFLLDVNLKIYATETFKFLISALDAGFIMYKFHTNSERVKWSWQSTATVFSYVCLSVRFIIVYKKEEIRYSMQHKKARR